MKAQVFMPATIIIVISLVIILSFSLPGMQGNSAQGPEQMETPFNSFEIEKPVVYKNLELFVITGKSNADNLQYVTLENAFKKSLVKVHETSQVNELQITNLSNSAIFIISGDIVKGGKQDRTMGNDVIIPPGVKNVPVESFCVESGRWSQRGEEKAIEFSSNDAMLSSKDLKIAAKYKKDQRDVWDKVARQQSKLKENVSYLADAEVAVADDNSPSSLQLTLENKELGNYRDEYKARFQSLIKQYKNAIGVVYAINGEVYGIDVFNNKTLFTDLYVKLIDAIIVEAISELDSAKGKRVNINDIKELALQCEGGKKTSENVNPRTEINTYESEEGIMFETIDLATNQWIHRNYLQLTEEDKVSPKPRSSVQQQFQNNRNY